MTVNLDPRFELRPSKIHGTGCFTRQKFRKGQYICNYEGERISSREALHRTKRKQSCCICYVNSNLAIDGNFGGNGTHYANHSCQPNCRLVFEKDEILIYALRHIKPNEELTVDYYYELYIEGRKCHCRTAFCREHLSGTDRFNAILQQFIGNKWKSNP